MSSSPSWRARLLGLAVAVVLLTLAVAASSLVRAERNPVEPAAALTVTLVLDKSQYLTGDTATANAVVYRTPSPGNYTYAWQVRDLFGAVVNQTASGTSRFTYTIPLDMMAFLTFQVTVDDGQGLTQIARQSALVSRAILSISLDRGDFSPGDTITASYSVASHVIVHPTYDYAVIDVAGTIVLSGTTNNTFFSFHTPSPASRTYDFHVTASQGVNSTENMVTIAQASGFILGVTFDKSSYAVGEAIHAHLTLTARGTAALPAQFRWSLTLGYVSVSALTNGPQADLSLPIPQGVGAGDVLVGASESSTGTIQFQAVRVGAASNPLWSTEIAGIPTFAVLLALLFVLLLVAVIALWRRTLGGPILPGAVGSRPAPPAPPEGPVRTQPSSPMSVVCRHCGKSIDLTTSKRPIEVMCPSCGETQLVS